MGVRQWLLLGIILGMWGIQAQAEVYRWKDASGRTIYGDNPPEGSTSAPLELPPLTISDGFKAPATDKPSADKTDTSKPASEAPQKAFKYESFEVTAPQKDEALRANDGTIQLALKLEPSLQLGHSIVLYLDGKQVADGTDLTFTFPNVDRGTHTVFAVIRDAKGEILFNTEVTTFHVLRAKKKRSLKENEEAKPTDEETTPSESQSGNEVGTRFI